MQQIQQRFVMKVFHWDAVSAIVAVVDGVQRLVHVTDKMDEIPDRFRAFYGIRRLIFQNGALLFNRARHAPVRAAVFLDRAFMLSTRNIDVMPRPMVPLGPTIVRPRGSITHPTAMAVDKPELQLRLLERLREQ